MSKKIIPETFTRTIFTFMEKNMQEILHTCMYLFYFTIILLCLMLESIRKEWTSGKPILIFDADNREKEVDLMIPSHIMTPAIIAQMRADAGGLICCAVSHEVALRINLPFISDIYEEAGDKYDILNKMLGHGLPYGAKSSFSISLNHVKSFTGITDIDRALTISSVGDIASHVNKTDVNLKQLFIENFRLPGHVPMLRGSEGLLDKRKGHTELGLALCEMIGLPPSVTMCEMMDSNSGGALSVIDAKAYAEINGLLYISGAEIIEIWRNRA
jgi:3,4-dihydroxy 2-butanone 4-phosphate synthase